MEEMIYHTNDNYDVVDCSNVIGEDGKYGPEGYGVRNKKNGKIESTGMSLPAVMFIADQFDEALANNREYNENKNAPKQNHLRLVDPTEDIIPDDDSAS